jgi:sialate O-acetylesterase
MVLQQQSQVKIWGWADPYENVSLTTSWDQKTYACIGSDNAQWQVMVETPAAGGPFTITIKGKNSIVLTNIMIGEVWICSGQSNMEMSGKSGLKDIKSALPTALNTNIRFFHIPKTTAPWPQTNGDGQWTICDSITLKTFSAVGYFFGKNLNKVLQVPIGLVEASWGGTSAEVWTPDSIVNNDPVLKAAAPGVLPSGMCPHIPGYAFNGMIAPVTNFNIAGVIWYQGENNTHAAGTYKQLFTAMIDGWRRAWNKNFPFYYVQIAPFKYRVQNTGALLREAQLQSMSHPNTGMVVITDLVDNIHDVHPANKHDVGLRLSNWALAETYHHPGVVYKSPGFSGMTIKNDKVVITFDQGIIVKGKTVTELLIAGEDKVFYPAEAVIKNNTITAWSKQVKKPVAVRYVFSDTAIGNLFNAAGLPVTPFRTDNWLVETK